MDIRSRSAAWAARVRGRHCLQVSPLWPAGRWLLGRAALVVTLRGQPMARRLAVVVLLPTTVAASFGLLRVSDAREAEQPLVEAQRYALISQAAVSATEALEDERDGAAPAVASEQGRPDLSGAYEQSDRGLAAVLAAVAEVRDPSLEFARDELSTRIATLEELRLTAFSDSLSAVTTVNRYAQLILDVIELGRRADSRAMLLAGDPSVAGRTLGVYDLQEAAGLNSQRRALGTALLSRGTEARGERAVLGGYGILVSLQTASFRSVAGPDTVAMFQAADVEAAAADVEVLAQRITAASEAGASVDLPLRQWTEVTTEYLTKVRQVLRNAVDRALADITALRAARAEGTRTNLAVVVAVLLGAVLLAGLVGGGLTVELHRLRDRMRDVGERRLPRLVAALAQPPVEPGSPSRSRRRPPVFPPGPAPSSPDEIGQVALAFENVHRQAIRLATAQAEQRATTAGIARTLTRRSQELIGRQLTLITELEQRELDPDKLNRLFGLDHLATRIRRHGDSLLVLTGVPAAWHWPQSATLTEVVQAAAASTEQYRRVEISPLPETGVRAAGIVDLLQILAELIDNATRFSPPDTPVRITAGPLAVGAMRVEVRDQGYGLGERAAAELNARLSHPRPDGITDEPKLGLHVAGTLAARTGIAVHLLPIERGCVATVVVPPRLLCPAPQPQPDPARAESPAGPSPVIQGASRGA
ncbi:nitrate- and nitrite sensing domain-containing protein [Actinoplanes sp. ATCC 53533]|uniref:sensor histidine kinase n=1 Tax=Actinoplanes sp. ATCC 53533 TaxID=1288362 RepID=UPI000F7899E2|nr:nitrate- and nitrite sensing domain-containing protein [Actinoplanes sp. ATCC 53533]